MRYFLLLLFALDLSGCASLLPKDAGIPTPNEFFAEQFAFPLRCSVDAARAKIITQLNRLNIPYEQKIEGLDTFVITSYVLELPRPNPNRETSSAFLFTLNPAGVPSRTNVTLRWKVTSKGDFDAEWRTLDEDKAFRPKKLNAVKTMLEEEKKCE